ncbi:hypothetical protein LDENG_00075500, partial [Lucifuga dentata]
TRKYDHITPVLASLHWLPVQARADFKVLLLTYKALHGLAPPHITEMLTQYEPLRSLTSSGGTLLAVPMSSLKSKGDRAFAIRALLLWNDLPEEISSQIQCLLLNLFLKPIFYRLAFVMSSLNCPLSCFYCLIRICCLFICLFISVLLALFFFYFLFYILVFTCSFVYHLCSCFLGSLTELFLNILSCSCFACLSAVIQSIL